MLNKKNIFKIILIVSFFIKINIASNPSFNNIEEEYNKFYKRSLNFSIKTFSNEYVEGLNYKFVKFCKSPEKNKALTAEKELQFVDSINLLEQEEI